MTPTGLIRPLGRRHQRPGIVDYLLLALLLAGGAPLAWHAVQLIRADFQMMEARATIDSWEEGRSTWDIKTWVSARDALLAAREITPHSPSIHDYLGLLHAVRGRDAWRSPGVQRHYFQEALRHQEASLALRPRHAWTWAAAAESLNAIEPGSPRVWEAWHQAYRWGPYEPRVQYTLLTVALASWRNAPPDAREAVKPIYASAPPSVQQRSEEVAKWWGVTGWRQRTEPRATHQP